MSENERPEPKTPQKAFTTFYFGEGQLFFVDFTGTLPFAPTSWQLHAENGMFTHGVCTDMDEYADGNGYLAFNKIVIAEKRVSSDSLSEELTYLLDKAAHKLSAMYKGAPKEWAGSTGHLHCEKAAQLINEHQAQMIKDLVASYNEYKRSESE